MTSLAGKTVLITAAAQGIGRASAEAFARAGCRVIATDVNEDRLSDLDGEGVLTRRLDVSNDSDVKAVAADFVTQGVRCNAVCPATVETPSLRERLSAGGDYEANRAAFIARQPIGRLARPEEIADLVVYLAGATYTTGQIHLIDGGWTA